MGNLFGARYYDARTSVWQSADPADRFSPDSGSIPLNLFNYGSQNPVRFVDPDGRLEYDTQTENFKIEKGDTLSSIGKETGYSVSDLMKANPSIKDSNKIYTGNSINIPASERINTFKNAASRIGDSDYAYSAANGDFAANTNKCNLFVNDMVNSAGGNFPQRTRFLIPRGPITAGEVGSNNQIDGLRIINPNNAAIGDILGWQRDFSDATGHTAIYAGNVNINHNGVRYSGKGSPGTIGAGSDTINFRTMDYLTGHGYVNPVYRRIRR